MRLSVRLHMIAIASEVQLRLTRTIYVFADRNLTKLDFGARCSAVCKKVGQLMSRKDFFCDCINP
jgi:hypothetical protein